MYSFNNDYSEGACTQIMQALLDTNQTQSIGYGNDTFCSNAKEQIQKQLQNTTCDIHFLVGGTQTNMIALKHALRPHEAIIAASNAHIHTHETGAIESVGHKIIIGESEEGKLLPSTIHKIMKEHKDEHMVKPKLVFISNATELGTIYTKEELLALQDVCKNYNLYFYMDGARLAMALAAEKNNVDLCELCNIFDMFYIGGTKCGALFGEALVIVNEQLKQDLRYTIKQSGGLLAKGRLLGIQFLTLFATDLYLSLARHANQLAQRIQTKFIEKNIKMLINSPTNQIFPILNKRQYDRLRSYCQFQIWEILDDQFTVIRMVTSYATKKEEVENLLQFIEENF